MWKNIWKKFLNYETISYLICGVLTTVVDFLSYSLFRKAGMGVGMSQALSWAAAVLFAYIVNKLIVFRNYNFTPVHLLKEGVAFFEARVLSGVVTWALLEGMIRLSGNRGFAYELFCKLTVSVINMVANYVLSKVWIFKNKGVQEENEKDV